MEAYLLIQSEAGRAFEVAEAAADLRGVRRTSVVTGPYDVVARAAVASDRELDGRLLSEVLAVPGVMRAVTCPISGHHIGRVPALIRIGGW